MRFFITMAVLAVLLSACGSSSATSSSKHHNQVSQNVPTVTPTAIPAGSHTVLLNVKGQKEDATTKQFSAKGAWRAHYTFQCMVTDPLFKHGVFQIYGINPKHPNGQEEIILYALTQQKVNTGVTDPVDAGSYKLRILADPVCHWHVVVKTV